MYGTTVLRTIPSGFPFWAPKAGGLLMRSCNHTLVALHLIVAEALSGYGLDELPYTLIKWHSAPRWYTRWIPECRRDTSGMFTPLSHKMTWYILIHGALYIRNIFGRGGDIGKCQWQFAGYLALVDLLFCPQLILTHVKFPTSLDKGDFVIIFHICHQSSWIEKLSVFPTSTWKQPPKAAPVFVIHTCDTHWRSSAVVSLIIFEQAMMKVVRSWKFGKLCLTSV